MCKTEGLVKYPVVFLKPIKMQYDLMVVIFVIPHAYMAMSTMCPCTNEHHGPPHQKFLLRCCDNWPSIILPSQEVNKDTTNMCLTIWFYIYHNVLRCTVHGRHTYHKLTTFSLCSTAMSSDKTSKVYTRKELVLIERSITEFHGKIFATCLYPRNPPLWKRTLQGI